VPRSRCDVCYCLLFVCCVFSMGAARASDWRPHTQWNKNRGVVCHCGSTHSFVTAEAAINTNWHPKIETYFSWGLGPAPLAAPVVFNALLILCARAAFSFLSVFLLCARLFSLHNVFFCEFRRFRDARKCVDSLDVAFTMLCFEFVKISLSFFGRGVSLLCRRSIESNLGLPGIT